MSDRAALNIANAVYDENRKNGLMICGINWGGDPSTKQSPEESSFFSDTTVNDYPYRNRLLRWFTSWGHPLETRRGSEGPFERSISQTNWLADQRRSMHARDIWRECIDQKSNFIYHLDALSPRVVLFCSTTLIKVLNSDGCLSAAEGILGRADPLRLEQKDVTVNGKTAKRFIVGFQEFDNCVVVGLPHPTGSVGLSDSYIAAFKDEIGQILTRFREGLTDQPSSPENPPHSARRLSWR